MLASCGQSQPTPAPATVVAEKAEAVQEVQSQFALAGTAWQLESAGEPEDELTVPPGVYPSVGFAIDRYSGFSGCDWFMGVYSVEGNTLRMEAPAMTQYGCEMGSDLATGAATYTDALWNVTEYAIEDGKLVMYTVENQRLLTMVPLESVPFEGTTWDLKFTSPQLKYWVPILAGTSITAQFDGSQLTGNAGCNDYAATYTRQENKLTLSELSVTEKSCAEPEGVMDQESEYLSVLQTVGMVNVFPRSLELLATDGTPILAYHAR